MSENERTVPATVKEKAEVSGRNGPEHKLQITSPWFDSPKNFPQTIYVPKALGDKLQVGETSNFILRSDGKIKDDYDGAKPWMWRWRFVRMAEAGETPEQAPTAPVQAPNGSKPSYQPDDARNASIQRQSAAKDATDIVVALLSVGKLEVGSIPSMWDTCYEHILGRIQGVPLQDGIGSATSRGHLVRAAEAAGGVVQEPPPPDEDALPEEQPLPF